MTIEELDRKMKEMKREVEKLRELASLVKKFNESKTTGDMLRMFECSNDYIAKSGNAYDVDNPRVGSDARSSMRRAYYRSMANALIKKEGA